MCTSRSRATGVNLHGSPHIYGVAVDPRVIRLGSKLKITPNPFNYDGPFTAFDTGGAIKGNRIDFYDWRGRAAQNGWGHRNVSVSTYTGSARLLWWRVGRLVLGRVRRLERSPDRLVRRTPPTVDNKAIYGVAESTVPTFGNTFSGAPVKGRVGTGPSKGMTMDQATARQAVLDGAPTRVRLSRRGARARRGDGGHRR
jgi:3D (Asp-Asp-Asp) domain-containing protein